MSTSSSTSSATRFGLGGPRIDGGSSFVSFLPAISDKAAKAIRETIRDWRLAATRNNQSLEDIARLVNPSVRGWVNYYGRFYRSAFTPVLRHLERALIRWACRKYKRLRRSRPPTQPIGWVRWRDAIPSCSFCGRSGYDRRLDHKSRMRRESPVRFREGLGVKFPRATRLVMGFACEEDARRVMDVLPKRFEKYGLTIHPDKTRLVPFERPSGDPQRDDLGGADSSRDLRPAGLHALLGTLPERELGGEAQDVQEPIPPWIGSPVAMVSAQPPSSDGGPAPDAESETAGPLRVLRDHRQLAGTEPFPHRGHMDLEALAVAPSAWWPDDLGPPQSLPEASPASASDRGPLGVPSRSDYVT